MAGIVGLSVGETQKENFTKDFFKAVFYQQHWNEGQAGIAVSNNKKKGEFSIDSKPGLFRANFEKKIGKFDGVAGIGYCGTAKEPLEIDTRIGKMCLCFSGNIWNCLELKEKLKNRGVSFSERTGDDLEIEVIANLIAQGNNVVDGIKKMNEKIKGTYTILILTPGKIFAARSPDGHWCLNIGQKKGEIVVASSTAGFSNLGLIIKREIKPGEIISVSSGSEKKEEIMPSQRIQACSFVGVYSDFPSGTFYGTPVSTIRKRLGASLARRDIESGFMPDIVAPVPDSGRFHAIGYHQEFCRQLRAGNLKTVPDYDEFLLKYPYSGRSFTPREERKRNLEADIKILPSSEDYQDKIVVIVDDSIVRGTQMSTNLVPKLRSLGIAEIHLRIANPELLSHCRWGKTTKRGESFALRFPTKKERMKALAVDGLEYNTVDRLIKAIGLPRDQLCLDCSLSFLEESK